MADHLHRVRLSLIDAADSARLDGEERFIATFEQRLVEGTDLGHRGGLRAGHPARPGQASPATAQASRMTTVEKPRVSGPSDTGLGGHWRVIVLNDDHNTFEGVATALSTVLLGSATTGHGVANQIHNSGRAIVWSGAASWPSTTGSSSAGAGSRWLLLSKGEHVALADDLVELRQHGTLK